VVKLSVTPIPLDLSLLKPNELPSPLALFVEQVLSSVFTESLSMTSLGALSQARSSQFSSSRILPSQSWRMRMGHNEASRSLRRP